MEYKVVVKPAFTLVGVKLEGSYDSLAKIPELWATFGSLAESIPDKVGEHMESYGVYLDGPEGFLYYAGVEVSTTPARPVNPPLAVVHVPAGKYAVFTHSGPVDGLGETMSRAQTTMAAAGLVVRPDAFKMEVYDERYHPTSQSSVMEIYYPIS